MAIGIGLVLIVFGVASGQSQPLPQTVAEASDFKSTSTSAQVQSFIDQCLEHRPAHAQKFVFGKTVENRDLCGVVFSKRPYELGDQDERVVALVIGNIHSGECAGKEALLMLIRQLAQQADHPWLQNCVVLIIPNYNADGNDRIGPHNRPGQIGPENGMGRRENAQNLDLNRDFVKLEAPETRALVQWIDRVNPHLFIDCHTTNGSRHRYQLTYDIPHNPTTAQPIRDYLRNKMMPMVAQRLEEHQDLPTFYYGNFNRDHTVWETFGHQPRYSTEYVGLRGRLAILSEAYAFLSYRDRIFATKQFVTGCFDYLNEHAGEVRMLLDSVDADLMRIARQQPSQIAVSLNARVEKFDQKVMIRGFQDDQPCEYECDFLGKYVATNSVPLPFVYVVPPQLSRLLNRLTMHGIAVERLLRDTQCNCSVATIKSLNRNERALQNHQVVQAESLSETGVRVVPAGSYIVRTAQPLGRLAAYLLECESDDGFVFWNFLDDVLKAGEVYPIHRIESPVELATEPVDEIPKSGRLRLDMIAGPNSMIPKTTPPSWVSDSEIEVSLYGNKFRLDARSMAFSPSSGNRQRLATEIIKSQLVESGIPDALAAEIVQSEPSMSKNRHWLVFDTEHYDVVFHEVDQRLLIIGAPDSSGELFSFSEDESKLAYVIDGALTVLHLESFEKTLVTADHPEKQLLGKLDWVYQEELYGRGNFKGYWFSPDAQSIAFLKLDQSNVNRYTVTDHIPIRGEIETTWYPKAGDPNPVVSVCIQHLTGERKLSWIDLSSYDQQDILVSNVSWHPASDHLILQVQDRQQTFLDILKGDRQTAQATRLLREQTPAWIESPGEPQWLADGGFLWLSANTGYRHLYHHHTDGQPIKPLTSGQWEVRDIVDLDRENWVAYFSSASESPLNLDLFRLDIKSGQITKLTQGAGVHEVSFSADKSMFIDTCSTFIGPPQHKLYRADGRFMFTVNASADDRLSYVGLQQPEVLTLQTMNEQPLDAYLIRPPNFDPKQKYPVLVHVYGGPQAPQVRNRFAGQWALWHQMLAQQGYVIWVCDNQSASYRSSKNVWPIHRDLGRHELVDIEHGIAWLTGHAWVDPDRIGIWGWSYGGYLAAYALTHSRTFKIGIAGAPVTDWRNYDSIYTERLMGLPDENPVGYDSSSVVKAAEQLRGKLLLIHGSTDDNVHLSNTLQLALALQKAGKQFEMMIYPKNRHAVRDPEQSAHLLQLMLDFVRENL